MMIIILYEIDQILLMTVVVENKGANLVGVMKVLFQCSFAFRSKNTKNIVVRN